MKREDDSSFPTQCANYRLETLKKSSRILTPKIIDLYKICLIFFSPKPLTIDILQLPVGSMKVNGGVPVFADVGEMKRNVRMAMMKQRYNVHELWKQYPPGKNLFLSPLRIVKLMIFLP